MIHRGDAVAVGHAGHAAGTVGAVSGWHTAATWMKLNLEASMDAEGASWNGPGPVPEFGPSPGFKNLKWLKPVHAGETLTFRTTVADKRVSASRPDWGLVLSQGTGHNEAGELVYEFNGAGFVERKGR